MNGLERRVRSTERSMSFIRRVDGVPGAVSCCLQRDGSASPKRASGTWEVAGGFFERKRGTKKDELSSDKVAEQMQRCLLGAYTRIVSGMLCAGNPRGT